MALAKVLVVDDVAHMREVVADYVLRPNGYAVLMAENGEQALEIAQRDRPDLIISDIKMPGLSGLDLLRAVHRDRPGLPVILITAEGSEVIAQQALRAGAADYFIKPFDPDELLQSVERALRRSGAAAPASAPSFPQAPALTPETCLHVLTVMDDAVLLLDHTDRVIWQNTVAAALNLASETGAVTSPDLAALLARRLDRGEIVLDDGRSLEAHLTLLHDGGRVAVLRDVSVLKRLELAKSDFVASIAHNLRTPLTTILGYIGLLERAGPLNAAQAEHIRRARAAVDEMSSMLDELLNLKQLESGHTAQYAVVDISQLVTQVVEAFRPQAAAKSISLTNAAASDLPPVFGHPTRLRHMLSNLVENAIKYTPNNGAVSVVTYAQGEFILVQISDSGIGITPADQPYLFDELFRPEAVHGTYGGLRLGLFLVKRIVDEHNGRIWVESRLHEGSRFTVMLPVMRAKT
ncbi:MAG: response regulator [Anaerolineales bacterium]|nr:response regulator [Anaerolineales bacterium]